MLTYKVLNEIADGAEKISNQLYVNIIKRIIERFAARFDEYGHPVITGTDTWQIQTLTEAGYLLEDIEKDIAKATKLQEAEIKAAFEAAGIKAFRADTEAYQAAGLIGNDTFGTLDNGQTVFIPAVEITQSPYYLDIMERNYKKTLNTWRNFTGTTASKAYRTFISECDLAYTLTIAGGISYTQAYTEAIKRISKDTLTITYTNSGKPRTDTIETATLRAIRTGVAQACGDVTIQRMNDLQWDIVLVSAHMGARTGENNDAANHAWWQGKFYSRSGTDKRFKPFEVCGYGTGEGLSGWNCRHSFGVGDGKNNPFDGLINSKENADAYELSQQQRALERRIRKTKNELTALGTGISNSDGQAAADLQKSYDRKAVILQHQNKRYNEFCAEHDLKRYDDRLITAQWDRRKAAEARAAAARWKKEHQES